MVNKVARAPGEVRDRISNALVMLLVLQAFISYDIRLPGGPDACMPRFSPPRSSQLNPRQTTLPLVIPLVIYSFYKYLATCIIDYFVFNMLAIKCFILSHFYQSFITENHELKSSDRVGSLTLYTASLLFD